MKENIINERKLILARVSRCQNNYITVNSPGISAQIIGGGGGVLGQVS